jgi:hypothetical protein
MSDRASHDRSVTLLDLLDQVLSSGVMAHGDLTISVAGVDLIYLGLRALLTSADRAEALHMLPPRAPGTLGPEPSAYDDLERTAKAVDLAASALPRRLEADPDNVERGLAKLVLTLIELLRQLMERQALRRVEAGTLTEAEIERLGVTFLRLQQRMEELKTAFGLQGEDLNLNLGPLGDLM